jgi:hypothetical protein
VDALSYTYSHAGPHLGHWGSATTNDRGEYRILGLKPGRWYVRVSKTVAYAAATGRVHRAGTEEEYGYTFYPGVAREEEAGQVDLAAGAEVRVDVPIGKKRTYHARGTVIDGRSGQPAVKARVAFEGQCYVETRADGTFDCRGITAGSYRMMAEIKGNPRMLSPVREVSISDRDVDGLVFRLDPALTMQGMAVAEGAAAAKLAGTRVTLEPLGGFGETERAQIAADGSFTFANLAPQAYRVMVDRRSAGLYVKSLRLGNQDAAGDGRIDVAPGVAPLTLTFASDGGTVSGSVQSAGPGPAPLEVTLAPAGNRAGRADLVTTVEVEADGSFTIGSVAPGEYKVYAWELPDEALAEYPEFRKVLESKSAAVTVGAGERLQVHLTAITAEEMRQARSQLR